jgi:hypothetical protein
MDVEEAGVRVIDPGGRTNNRIAMQTVASALQ